MKRPRSKGFTLVELLVVMAMIAILSFLAIPAISSLLGSENVSRHVAELSDLMEVAREYATANNTYVWVAFYPSTSPNGVSSVSVAALASNDGTDPSSGNWPAYSYGTVPNAQISLISKILTLQQISILGAGSVSVDTLPPTPVITSPDPGHSFAMYPAGFFSLVLPGTSTPLTFTNAIEFLPSGQVRNSSSPIAVIDLDVEPLKGNVPDTKNVVVLRINGLTGQTVVYRQ